MKYNLFFNLYAEFLCIKQKVDFVNLLIVIYMLVKSDSKYLITAGSQQSSQILNLSQNYFNNSYSKKLLYWFKKNIAMN